MFSFFRLRIHLLWTCGYQPAAFGKKMRKFEEEKKYHSNPYIYQNIYWFKLFSTNFVRLLCVLNLWKAMKLATKWTNKTQHQKCTFIIYSASAISLSFHLPSQYFVDFCKCLGFSEPWVWMCSAWSCICLHHWGILPDLFFCSLCPSVVQRSLRSCSREILLEISCRSRDQ